MIDLHSPSFLRDPFPTYQRLRDEAPFHFDAVSRNWFVSRHGDIQTILRDPSMFSSENASFDTSLLGADGPTHDINRRRLLQQSRQWHRRWAQTIEMEASNLLQDRAGGEPFDAVEDYAMALAVRVVRHILGIASLGDEPIRLLSQRIMIADARAELRGMVSAHVGAAAETDTFAGDLRKAGVDEHAIVEICMLLIAAAVLTTKSLVGSAILRLLADPEMLQIVMEDDEALSDFLEEVLRFTSPVQRVSRLTRRTFASRDAMIPAGSNVILLLGSGNRDERVFSRAEIFERSRKPNPHLAFGGGDHFCLGAQLARTQAFRAIRTLFALFPHTALAERHADAVLMELHPLFHGPKRLMVRAA